MFNVIKLASEFEKKISTAQYSELNFYKKNYEYLVKYSRSLVAKIENLKSFVKERDAKIENLEADIEKKQAYINRLQWAFKKLKEEKSGYKY